MKNALACISVSVVVACGTSSPPANPAPLASAAPSSAPSAPAAPPAETTASTDAGPPASRASSARRGTVTSGAVQVNGAVAPDAIRGVAERRFGAVRECYDASLAKDPKVQGVVAVKVQLDQNGAITDVSDGGSDVTDKDLVTCVLGVFRGLTFPRPEGGVVTAVYAVRLSNGTPEPAGTWRAEDMELPPTKKPAPKAK